MLYNSLYIQSYYKLHQTDNMTHHLWCLITSTIRQDTPFISCRYIMSQLGEYDTQCNIYHVSLQAPYSKIHLFYHFCIYHVTSRELWYTMQHLSCLITSSTTHGAKVYIMQHHNAEYNVAYHGSLQVPWYMNDTTFYVKFFITSAVPRYAMQHCIWWLITKLEDTWYKILYHVQLQTTKPWYMTQHYNICLGVCQPWFTCLDIG